MSHVSKAAYPVLKQVLCSNAHIKYGPTTSDPTTAFFSPLPTSAPPWDEQRSTDVLRGPPLLVCLPPLEATPAASSHASDASTSEATPAASSHADAACSYASMAPPTAFSVLTALFGGKSEEEGDRARAFSSVLALWSGRSEKKGSCLLAGPGSPVRQIGEEGWQTGPCSLGSCRAAALRVSRRTPPFCRPHRGAHGRRQPVWPRRQRRHRHGRRRLVWPRGEGGIGAGAGRAGRRRSSPPSVLLCSSRGGAEVGVGEKNCCRWIRDG
jgi:hypothetical protein